MSEGHICSLIDRMDDENQHFVAQIARLIALIMSRQGQDFHCAVARALSGDRILHWIATSDSVHSCWAFLTLLACYVRYELPYQILENMVSLLSEVMDRHRGEEDIISAVVYFSFTALHWCKSEYISPLMNFRANLSRGHTKFDVNRDMRIYLLVSKVYIRENRWLDMNIVDFVEAVRDEDMAERVRFQAAGCIREMLKCKRPDLIAKLNTDVLQM
jgi:hypothetical protein